MLTGFEGLGKEPTFKDGGVRARQYEINKRQESCPCIAIFLCSSLKAIIALNYFIAFA